MAAHAGERAWKTGTFICQECNAEVRVKQGSAIPRCPNGHTTYDERVDEPAGQRSRATSLGRRRTGRADARPRSAARTAGRRKRPARNSARKSRASASRSRAGSSRKTSRSSSGKRSPGRRTARKER